MSSLRRGHANLLCIVPILTDDLRRGSRRHWRSRTSRASCRIARGSRAIRWRGLWPHPDPPTHPPRLPMPAQAIGCHAADIRGQILPEEGLHGAGMPACCTWSGNRGILPSGGVNKPSRRTEGTSMVAYLEIRAHPDLNQGPADLQSAALTTELCTHVPLYHCARPIRVIYRPHHRTPATPPPRPPCPWPPHF